MAESISPLAETPPPVLSRTQMGQFLLTSATLQASRSKPQQLADTLQSTMLPIALSRISEIDDPTELSSDVASMDPATRQLVRMDYGQRLNTYTKRMQETEGLIHEVAAMAQLHPDIAAQVGLNEGWWDRLQEGTVNAAKKGWTALDYLLRNLDRGRGALAAYYDTIKRGGTDKDAKRRAYDTFMGSVNGWVWLPQEQGPSWSEVMRHLGASNDWGTKSAGFALDVLLDPVNLLGTGFARKGIELGAHQVLNEQGRAMRSQIINTLVSNSGAPSFLSLPVAEKVNVLNSANEQMRMLLRDKVAAERLLDMGGLKFAGFNLVHAPLKPMEYINMQGHLEHIYGVPSVKQVVGSKVMSGIDHIGRWSEKTALPLPERLRELMTLMPENMRKAGEGVGLLFNRTNPAAPHEYKVLKQAQYYDRLAFEGRRALDDVRDIFHGFDDDDLTEMAYAVDEGRVAQLRPEQQQAVATYNAMMDTQLKEEVSRGIARPEWNSARRERFGMWIDGQLPDTMLGKNELKDFTTLRLPNYVTHVYRNKRKAERLVSHELRPSAPTITQPFLNRRLFPTLREAQDAGLVPETNLAKLAAYRLEAGKRATVTFDFLKDVSDRFGWNYKGYTPVTDSGKIIGQYEWQDAILGRTRASGKFALPIDEQQRMAYRVAREANVPAEFVAKLDDSAAEIFMRERFKTMKPTTAKKFWDQYVVRPTQMGMYDGYALAGGRTVHEAVAKARDLADPVYDVWDFITVGGRTDPAVLRRIMAPKPIADDIGRLRQSTMPPELLSVLRLYDTVNFWWKRAVTLPFPAFHVRNKLTNVVNSAADIGLMGVLSRDEMHAIMRGKDGVLDAGHGLKYTYEDIRQLMREHGVVQPIYRRMDIGEATEVMLRSELKESVRKDRIMLPGGAKRAGQASIANPLKAPFKTAEDLAGVAENSDRAQLFIASLKRGLDPQAAANRVSRFLFDYNDISKFEQQWIRRLIPFWTWSRKNIALQARLAVEKDVFAPHIIATMGKFARALSEEKNDAIRSDVERELLPNALADEFGVRIDTAKGLSHWLLHLDLPATDFNKIWAGSRQDTIRQWLTQINPYMQQLLEDFTATDLMTGASTGKFDRGMRQYDILLSAPKSVQNFLNLRQTRRRDDMAVEVDPKRYRMLMAATLFTGARVMSTIGKLTDPDERPMWKIFNLLTGARLARVSPVDEINRRNDRMLFDDDKGLQPALQRKKAQFLDMLKMHNLQDAYRSSSFGAISDRSRPAPSPQELQEELDILTPRNGRDMEDAGLDIEE